MKELADIIIDIVNTYRSIVEKYRPERSIIEVYPIKLCFNGVYYSLYNGVSNILEINTDVASFKKYNSISKISLISNPFSTEYVYGTFPAKKRHANFPDKECDLHGTLFQLSTTDLNEREIDGIELIWYLNKELHVSITLHYWLLYHTRIEEYKNMLATLKYILSEDKGLI